MRQIFEKVLAFHKLEDERSTVILSLTVKQQYNVVPRLSV
jgi:hypothetical protein